MINWKRRISGKLNAKQMIRYLSVLKTKKFNIISEKKIIKLLF